MFTGFPKVRHGEELQEFLPEKMKPVPIEGLCLPQTDWLILWLEEACLFPGLTLLWKCSSLQIGEQNVFPLPT